MLNSNFQFLFYTGPKPEEVTIFWQMVMEQKPAVVVMLTKVEENGKVVHCVNNYSSLCISSIIEEHAMFPLLAECAY